MRTRASLVVVLVLAALGAMALGAGSASAAVPPKTAPPYCRVFNPQFEWNAGQERYLRASDHPCDAAPGRRAWLVFQTNGNLAFYLDGEQLWDSGTKGQGKFLVERGYGGLDIETGEHSTIWGTGAPGAEGFEPHPSGGFGIGFTSESQKATNAFTHWTQDEGLCGPEGGCGATLWESGKGVL